jgi:hypothetical protein
MCTVTEAPGAAKCSTDANITRSGAVFLAMVRRIVKDCSEQIALPDNLNQAQHQFLVLQQWREIEEMLVEMGP